MHAGSSVVWLLDCGSEQHSATVLWRSAPTPLVANDRNPEASSEASLYPAASSVLLHYSVRSDCLLAVHAYRQLGKPACVACCVQLVGIAHRFIATVASGPSIASGLGCLCGGRSVCGGVLYGCPAYQLRDAVPTNCILMHRCLL